MTWPISALDFPSLRPTVFVCAAVRIAPSATFAASVALLAISLIVALMSCVDAATEWRLKFASEMDDLIKGVRTSEVRVL